MHNKRNRPLQITKTQQINGSKYIHNTYIISLILHTLYRMCIEKLIQKRNLVVFEKVKYNK